MNASCTTKILIAGLFTVSPLLAANGPVLSALPDVQAAQESRRESSFAKLHGEKGTGDLPGTTHPRMALGAALSAFATVTEGFDYSGRGDADYWMKVTIDFGRHGVGLGQGLQQLAGSMGSGPLPAAVAGMGAQLTSIDWSGRGDAEYWMARAKDVALRVKAVGDQLRAMAQASGPTDGYEVSLAAVLHGLATAADSVNTSGRGDAEYWMRTTRDFARFGRSIGRGMQSVLPSVSGPLAVVLTGVAAQFNGLNEGGTGTVDYWMARAQGVGQQMHGLARSLADIARSL